MRRGYISVMFGDVVDVVRPEGPDGALSTQVWLVHPDNSHITWFCRSAEEASDMHDAISAVLAKHETEDATDA